MKQVFAVILILFYFSSSSGAVIHLHFCMDEFAGISLNDETDNETSCRYCGMNKIKSHATGAMVKAECCKDKSVSVKIDNSYRSCNLFCKVNNQPADFSVSSITERFATPCFLLKLNAVCSTGPPCKEKSLVFLRISNLRL